MTVRRALAILAAVVALAIPAAVFGSGVVSLTPSVSVVAFPDDDEPYVPRCQKCADGVPHDLAEHADPSGGLISGIVSELNGDRLN